MQQKAYLLFGESVQAAVLVLSIIIYKWLFFKAFLTLYEKIMQKHIKIVLTVYIIMDYNIVVFRSYNGN